MSVTVQVKRSGVAELKKKLESLSVVAGLPANSNPYPDGTSVVRVASDHEFGSSTARTYTSPRGNTVSVSGVPERSFLRSTAKEKRGAWTKLVKKHIGFALKRSEGLEVALDRVGQIMKSDIQLKIKAITTPPNSPQVIADKGSSNPLIDTGHLIGSIAYDVRKS